MSDKQGMPPLPKAMSDYPMRGQATYTVGDMHTYAREYATQQTESLREQLAAAQAREAELREDVRLWISANDPEGFGCACTPEAVCGTCKWADRVETLTIALRRATNTTALQQAIASAREEMRRTAISIVDAECIGFADDDAQLRRIIAAIEALPAEPTAADQPNRDGE